ncbi:MAG: chromosome segregation protein SMC [Methylococcales bacterium]|nr:chromosome segregation protein SMC [Methylococcales bacterium]
MRLEKIKLAGFKSFVDPTTVPIPRNLVAVIGPNGCGKSNVIDAVRWVMGESSAKNLRGESMVDVIFNGSTSRKPVGLATIELCFENIDGSAGGQYAQYTHISVKRQLSRDGQSIYFLNNTRCRRKDITDLFMGTGLGPRSYAIIEQGTISRIVEAKPEELRVFIEEAAGISKYKERRRETETRIRHTRDNLDRLLDVRDEVEKQLKHLGRQAKVAEKYKLLKEQERQFQEELTALQWFEQNKQRLNLEKGLTEREKLLESLIAEQRRIENALLQDREKHLDFDDQYKDIQAQFYSVGSDIVKAEQTIKHSIEQKQQQKEELKRIEESISQTQSNLTSDQERIIELQNDIDKAEPNYEMEQEKSLILEEQIEQIEEQMMQVEQDWDELNSKSSEPSQTAQIERTNINHLEQQMTQSSQRIKRLENDLSSLVGDDFQLEIEKLSMQEVKLQIEIEQANEKSDQIILMLKDQRVMQNSTSQQWDQLKKQVQSKHGRLSSLEALQQAMLQKNDKTIKNWLQTHQLENAESLFKLIEADQQWQTAVEIILQNELKAICVDDIGNYQQALNALKKGSIYLHGIDSTAKINATLNEKNKLLHYVQLPENLNYLLDGIYIAENWGEAFKLHSSLMSNESVITPDGLWLGPHWAKLNQGDQQQTGALAREQEINQLKVELTSLETEDQLCSDKVDNLKEALLLLEDQKESLQKQTNQSQRELNTISSQLNVKKSRQEQSVKRKLQLESEINEIELQSELDENKVIGARERLHNALDEVVRLSEVKDSLQVKRDNIKHQFRQQQVELVRQKDSVQAIHVSLESKRVELKSKSQGLERERYQIEQLDDRQQQIKQQMENSGHPLEEIKSELDLLLNKRLEVESTLNKIRDDVEMIRQLLNQHESDRHAVENKIDIARQDINAVTLSRQEILISSRNLLEKIGGDETAANDLLKVIDESATIKSWQQMLDELSTKIQKLGTINLAAIDEYEEHSERMQYLTSQHDDLTESLETLEDAIRKIDRETRHRFKDTFERVNSGFKEKFPKLFGGGQAELELTGDDLLDTGITVMARPPGKKNSTIHLLSGGEKALTAVSLVFAIFDLNPAPFCMLDEVDAPLDEANVRRFCELVREMSKQVQFIFITHNKTTMELANQLSGVTMQEPGVSRLVAVDVDEAVEMIKT